LPIILAFVRIRRVSLSPRSGRNERSEWRTAHRAVDWRGAQPPQRLRHQPQSCRREPGGPSAFRFTWLAVCWRRVHSKRFWV